MDRISERKSRTVDTRSRLIETRTKFIFNIFLVLFLDEEKRRKELKVIEEEP
jgi:hypothetical protein